MWHGGPWHLLLLVLLPLGVFPLQKSLEFTPVDHAVAVGVDFGETLVKRRALQFLLGQSAVGVLVERVEIIGWAGAVFGGKSLLIRLDAFREGAQFHAVEEPVLVRVVLIEDCENLP